MVASHRQLPHEEDGDNNKDNKDDNKENNRDDKKDDNKDDNKDNDADKDGDNRDEDSEREEREEREREEEERRRHEEEEREEWLRNRPPTPFPTPYRVPTNDGSRGSSANGNSADNTMYTTSTYAVDTDIGVAFAVGLCLSGILFGVAYLAVRSNLGSYIQREFDARSQAHSVPLPQGYPPSQGTAMDVSLRESQRGTPVQEMAAGASYPSPYAPAAYPTAGHGWAPRRSPHFSK